MINQRFRVRVTYLSLLISALFFPYESLAQDNNINVYERSGRIHVGLMILDRTDSTVDFKDFYGRITVPIDSIVMIHIYKRGGVVVGFQKGFGTGIIYGALAGAIGGLFLKNNQPGTTDVEFKVLAITGSALAGSAVLALAGGFIGAILNIGSSIDEQYIFSDMDIAGKRHMLDEFILFRKTGKREF